MFWYSQSHFCVTSYTNNYYYMLIMSYSEVSANNQYNQNVIGITSLWLLYPLLMYTINTKTRNTRLSAATIASLWIYVCCIISYLMWKDYDEASTLYTLDIWFARGTFCFLIYITFFVQCNWITRNTKFLLPLGVGGFYILACIFHAYGHKELSMWSHLTFRFIGFWWTYVALNPSLSVTRLFIISMMYWVHIVYYKRFVASLTLSNDASNDDASNDDEYYKGTYELLSIITYSLCLF